MSFFVVGLLSWPLIYMIGFVSVNVVNLVMTTIAVHGVAFHGNFLLCLRRVLIRILILPVL